MGKINKYVKNRYICTSYKILSKFSNATSVKIYQKEMSLSYV